MGVHCGRHYGLTDAEFQIVEEATQGWRCRRMGKFDKLLRQILQGQSDASIRFAALCQLLRNLGFTERIRGDHHIFTNENVEEILNLQPRGARAKPYQVKQVRNVFLKYQIGAPTDAEAEEEHAEE